MADAGTRVAEQEERRGLIGVRRTLGQIGIARLILTLVLLAAALAVARYSWTMPLASDAERGLYDLRFYRTADRVGQDERITLVTYTDQTLEQLGKRSPLDRRMMAQALRAIDGMNPRAIGIDILIDQPQPEDAELIATMRAMHTPTFLAFASSNVDFGNPEQMQYWQEQYLRSFLQQVRSGPVRPASIRIDQDLADGVMRRWPGPQPNLPTLLANAMTPGQRGFFGYTGAIDYRIPDSPEVPIFTELPVEMLASLVSGELPPEESAAIAESLRPMIEGRHILLGGNIQLLDDLETPMSRQGAGAMKGMVVHAHMLAQALDGRMPRPIPDWLLWVAALVIVAGGALTAVLEGRGWILGVAVIVQVGLIAAIPFLLEARDVETIHLPAAGWGAGWLLAVLGAGIAARAVGSEQRKFASSALGKYLPADVAAQIMRDPDRLALKGEKKQIYALFTDLEGFTKLSHAIQPEQLSSLLNHYLDMLSDIVLNHGGTIDKFVGDAVIAFWGAPISRPDDGDRAVKAAVAMFEAGEEFRRTADLDGPVVGRTRVGLHRGEAVVGNFGGQKRIQYTALGDGMNTASRLESANKALQTSILVSTAVKEQTDPDLYRPMGRVVLSGRATPIEIWEPVPHMDADVRKRLRDLWQRYDGGDREALGEIEQVAAAHPDDLALHNFVFRLREAGPGGAFVLESK